MKKAVVRTAARPVLEKK